MTSSNLVGCWTGRSALLLAPEDAIDVVGSLPVLCDEISPVRDHATRRGKVACGIDCGKAVPGHKRDDQLAMRSNRRPPALP